jgi:hypothetical protein
VEIRPSIVMEGANLGSADGLPESVMIIFFSEMLQPNSGIGRLIDDESSSVNRSQLCRCFPHRYYLWQVIDILWSIFVL